MKEMNLKYFIFYSIFWSINQTKCQVAKCDYSYQNYWSTGYKTTNTSYYTCYLDTRQANYNEKLIQIDGKHEIGHSDDDVKWIGNNKLKTFSSIICQKFPNLKVVQITDAELDSIEEDSLFNCNNLDHLLMHKNKIRELPEYILIKNSKLTLLRLYSNQLTTVPENFLLYQKNLEDLDLNDNQIEFLPGNIFRSLQKLELLYLYKNKLRSINPEWFVNLQNLKWLRLDGNQISDIPSKCFAALRNLEKLWIYENRIKSLKSDNFDGLQNLNILNLNDNEIFDLPVDVFASLKSLDGLSLNNNKLTTIHSDSFKSVHNKFTSIYVGDNLINAIDEKLIDDISTLFHFNMTNNICSQLYLKTRNQLKSMLKECFNNYQPRHQHQSQISRPFHHQLIASTSNICGRSSTGQGNIIGGSTISRGSFPWITALVKPTGDFFCGGTLVSNRKVLTAAHCIQDKHTTTATTASEIIVQLGVYDLKRTIEIGRIPYAVETVNVHSSWNTLSEPYDYDIAVLVLDTEVTFNKFIQPICMPNLNIVSIKTGIVVGFGKSEDTTKVHENIPKMLETPIHSNEDCFFHEYRLVKLSSKRTFCGGTGTGIGVCRGDSGGGLIVNDGGAYYLRGIVSSSLIGGPHGCDVDTYSVYTDVTKYIDWINGISTSRF
ncbi:unnamed protein product [Chironomus riparius]|uniref:Peptidase S1 domain-containing protein n=1 Tax=Chironomus riparius TaxID=315576 RepID=A0A9N9S5F7_9DIPT|nr:unnamed protein product [Chironomus riparius]